MQAAQSSASVRHRRRREEKRLGTKVEVSGRPLESNRAVSISGNVTFGKNSFGSFADLNATITAANMKARKLRWLAGLYICIGDRSELHKQGTSYPVFAVAKIWTPARHERSQGSGVSSRRRDTSRSGEVRNVCRAVVVLQAVGDVLARHVVCCDRSVPGLERISRVLGEVWCSRRCRRSIDRRQQHELRAGVVGATAAYREGVLIAIKQQAVVDHEAEEALLRSALGIAVETDATAALATCVSSECRCSHAYKMRCALVVHVLDTVVGVVAGAGGYAKGVLAITVLVAENLQPAGAPPQDLSAESRPVVKPAIGLPSVDEPRLNLQLGCWKPLHTHTVEEPWCIRRDVRRLIGPVVELVKREQSDVRQEDAGVHVEAVLHVEMVAGVGLTYITIGVGKVPLSTRGTGIVAGRGRGVQTDLAQKAGPHSAIVEVAADSKVCQRSLAGPKDLA